MLKNVEYEIIFDPSGDRICQFSAIAYFLCSFCFECSANQLHEEVADYLNTHRKNEEGQPYQLFAGIPWSSYLNEIRLNGTYGDHITLDAISLMYNVCIQVISSLGPQATVKINQENGPQAMVMRQARWPLCLLNINSKFWFFTTEIGRTYFWYW